MNAKFGWRIGCGTILMLAFVAPFTASAIYGLTEGQEEGAIRAFAIAGACLLVFGIIPLLLIFQKRGSVRRFDAQGVTRFDGKTFPWSEFRGARQTLQRNKYGHTSLFRIDLTFQSGKASIFARVVENIAEVSAVAAELEAGRNRWA